MEEFWVCGHCRSLNRAGSGKCYSCKQKYGSQPKAAASVVKGSALVAPPQAGVQPMADFRAAAAPAALAAAAPPAYLSRPIALAPLAPAFSGGGYAAPARTRSLGPSNPVNAIKRRIARSLAMRQSVSVSWLGYLATILLTVLIVAAVGLVMTLLPVAASLLQHADGSAAWATLTRGQHGTVKTLAEAFAGIGILWLLCFSVFLGLTTHNATGLGAAAPLLTPYGGGIVWPIVIWNQLRIAVGLVVPATLVLIGYPIPGVLAALVAVEIAQRHMDDPVGWLTRPYRHLPDLYSKLGIEGSIDSPIAALWSACFRAANGFAIATFALPLLGLLVLVAAGFLGRNSLPGWQSVGLGPAQVGVALVVGGLLVGTLGTMILTVPLTFGLVGRQRTRRTLARVGRSRSWVARPGQGGYTPGPVDTMPPGFDSDDRVIERYPRQPDAGPIDGPGFGPFGAPVVASGPPGFGVGSVQGFGPAGPHDDNPPAQGWPQGFGPADGGRGPQSFPPAGTQSYGPVVAQGGPGLSQSDPGFGRGPRLSPGFGPGEPSREPQGFGQDPRLSPGFGAGDAPRETQGFVQAPPPNSGAGQPVPQRFGPPVGQRGPRQFGPAGDPGLPPEPPDLGAGPDQASLNSPSTTSSPPWSGEPFEPPG